MRTTRARRRGFSLVEVVVALTLLTGVLLSFAYFSQQLMIANANVTARALASDLAVARLEEIKAHRTYSTLVATYDDRTETWTGMSPHAGFTRLTFVTRTGPTAEHDFVTVTVVVSGRSMIPPVRRSTSVAAF